MEKLALRDLKRYHRYLSVSYNLFERGGLSRDSLMGQALEENRRRAMDRIYRLLGHIYPGKDMRAARWAIERGDRRARASAIEYLDNTLSGNVRKMLLPILDEAPLAEKVRKANVFLKTRVKDLEETLARLVYDDDAVIAAIAIDTVRENKLWSLAEDLEQVVRFRAARDFAVFESASYALAAYRVERSAAPDSELLG